MSSGTPSGQNQPTPAPGRVDAVLYLGSQSLPDQRTLVYWAIAYDCDQQFHRRFDIHVTGNHDALDDLAGPYATACVAPQIASWLRDEYKGAHVTKIVNGMLPSLAGAKITLTPLPKNLEESVVKLISWINDKKSEDNK